MGDPELRSDENILLRTPGVYVKSIPFEGILTNKRIILVDRATNLLPQKEIALVTIKDIEAGENAIRDQIIKLSVLTRTGDKRQMILTFSRQAGGNRIRERDAWLKALKENTSSTFEQVIRKVIPGLEPASKKPERSASPRIKVRSSPGVQNIPAAGQTAGKKERDGTSPVKKIIEISPAPASPLSGTKESESSSPQFGTYCSRCGNRVPDGSGFCNRCGSRIFVPTTIAPSPGPKAAISQPRGEEGASDTRLPKKDSGINEPFIEPSAERIRPWAVQQEPGAPGEQEPVDSLTDTTSFAPEVTFAETGEKPDTGRPMISDSRYHGSVPPPGRPPGLQSPRDGLGFKPGKKAVTGIVVVIIIIAVILGGFFLYPLIANGSGGTSDDSPSPTPSHTTTPTIVKNSGAVVVSGQNLVVAPTKTPQPAGKVTSPADPGNSPANVGF